MGYQRLAEHQWESPPWEFKIATGFGGRFSGVHKFGYNAAVGVGAFEDIWSVGGDLSYLSSAETMEITSSSGDDDSAGTGAQKIMVQGVDGDYKSIDEEITMDGTNDVTTTNTFLRVFRMFITDVGSGDVNAGNITATASSAATIQAQIDTDTGQTLMSLTTIPDGFYAIVTEFGFAATGLDTAIIDFQVREEDKGWRVHGRSNIPTAERGGADLMRFKSPFIVPPHADMKMRGIKASGVGSTVITGNFSYYLIDEREIRT